jgi:hypothetical protein
MERVGSINNEGNETMFKMTSEEAFASPWVHYPKRDILRILRGHGVESVHQATAFETDGSDALDSTFWSEFGDAESYSLAEVLRWLGY